MRRFTIIAICLVAIACLTASTAWSQNVAFNRLSGSVSGDAITACFKLTGLGNASTVDVKFTATVTFTCSSRGHGGTQTTNANQTLTNTQTFTVGPKPGTTSGCISLVADCPGNATNQIATINPTSISNLSITATADTGSVTATSIPGIN